MGTTIFPAPVVAVAKSLNKSQVFTTSGTWTAPTGVTYANVQLRGGNGTHGGLHFSGDNGSNTGTTGGTTSAFSVSAVGGVAGVSGSFQVGTNTQSQHDSTTGTGPATISFFTNTTPGTGYTITVGTGDGAFAVVSWAE